MAVKEVREWDKTHQSSRTSSFWQVRSFPAPFQH